MPSYEPEQRDGTHHRRPPFKFATNHSARQRDAIAEARQARRSGNLVALLQIIACLATAYAAIYWTLKYF